MRNPAKGHNGEKGPVHNRQSGLPQLLLHPAEYDLTEFILNIEELRFHPFDPLQNLVHRGICGV